MHFVGNRQGSAGSVSLPRRGDLDYSVFML